MRRSASTDWFQPLILILTLSQWSLSLSLSHTHTHTYIYICVHIHILIHTNIQKHRRTHTYTHTHARARTHTRTHIHTPQTHKHHQHYSRRWWPQRRLEDQWRRRNRSSYPPELPSVSARAKPNKQHPDRTAWWKEKDFMTTEIVPN